MGRPFGNRLPLMAVRANEPEGLEGRGDKVVSKLLMILVVSSGLALSACNTVRGAAADVESVGDCADGRKGNC